MEVLKTGDVVQGYGISSAKRCKELKHPPIAMINGKCDARMGGVEQRGGALVFSDKPTTYNYWFVNNSSAICYCVVHCNELCRDGLVISDNFAGCEFHVLRNGRHNLLAFMHVMRQKGKAVGYKVNESGGWSFCYGIKSSGIHSHNLEAFVNAFPGKNPMASHGMNLAVTYITRQSDNVYCASHFVNLRSGRVERTHPGGESYADSKARIDAAMKKYFESQRK